MKREEEQAQTASPGTLRRLEREANDMGLTVDQLIDRALIALADEVDMTRLAGAEKSQ
ncbi:hypothetical protein [Paraburkholderia phenoliruptrix]|uniref:hypothetical protein n=1 Tax=Paraburkholderia phenoliruptrix TaxID=252970 RepID=UPI001C4ECD63|nr:hypothetical protein [Paraburkholderia phenoliruptrix]MBW0449267.1 hypothetical protein [Paraburkholderia phenoliruptrix]MBW9097547.1 hypothetical protein [Paraburkholderia phenoliruptrix]